MIFEYQEEGAQRGALKFYRSIVVVIYLATLTIRLRPSLLA